MGNKNLDFRKLYGYGGELDESQLPADLAEAMADAANVGMLNIPDAKQFVETPKKQHRTLQASVMNFMLAAVVQYGEQVGEAGNYDPRNEEIAKSCQEIYQLHKNDEIFFNPYI